MSLVQQVELWSKLEKEINEELPITQENTQREVFIILQRRQELLEERGKALPTTGFKLQKETVLPKASKEEMRHAQFVMLGKRKLVAQNGDNKRYYWDVPPQEDEIKVDEQARKK